MRYTQKGFLSLLILGGVFAIGLLAFYFLKSEVDVDESINPSPTSKTVEVSPSPKIVVSPSPMPSKVLLQVPFAAQAPLGRWSDPRQQDGCEETAAYMAVAWARGEKIPQDKTILEKELTDISDWQQKEYGSYHDTNSRDTIERIFKGYFKYTNVEYSEEVSVQSIKEELAAGNIILVPANGQLLGNPNFTAPGPERHNLVIKGYDDIRGEFITNDNGTRQGESYRYKYSVLINAIRDYPTGDHLPILGNEKTMIIVKKS